MKLHQTLSRFPLATWLLLFFAAGLYAFCSSLYFPGLFIDDALYILLARALRQGVYAHTYLPFYVPEIHHLPGYPLLLAPIDFLLGGSFIPPRFISLSAILICGILLFSSMKPDLSNTNALLLLAAYLFNASVVEFSTTIMAEPLFLALTMLIAFFINKEKKPNTWALGLALGYTCLLRPQGLFFFAALAGWALLEKKLREFLPSFLVGAAIFLPVYGRSLFVKSSIPSYLSISFGLSGGNFPFADFLQHLKAVLGMTFPKMLCQFPAPEHVLARKFLAWGTIGGSLLLMGLGLRKLSNPFLKLGGIYIVISLLGLTFWPVFDPRFSLPLLPFILALIINGAETLDLRKYLYVPLTLILGFLLMGFNFKADAVRIKQALQERHMNVSGAPTETMKWLQSNTAVSDVILSAYAPVVSLHTNRKSLLYFPCPNRDFFRSYLSKYNVQYAFLRAGHELLVAKTNAAQERAMIEQEIKDPANGRLVYKNETEGTEVYRLQMLGSAPNGNRAIR